MKYRDPDTREFKDITVKTSDTLPIGTIVDYDGTEVPSGWENVENYGMVYLALQKTILMIYLHI